MTVSKNDVVVGLVKMGLSENQAKIYLYLVEHGEVRIEDIAKATAIPRSSVYQNLKGLGSLGLIEEIVDQGLSKIRAYPVSVLKHGLTEKQANLEEVEKSIGNLAKPKTDTTKVRYYRGVPGARQLFWNTLATHDTVLVYSAFGRSKFVGKPFYMDFVAESKRRNFSEKVIINPTEHALGLIRRDNNTPLARTKINTIRCIEEKQLMVNGETFIYDNIYAVVYLRDKEITGFEIESSDFANTQKSMFKTFWNLAKPAKGYL